MLQNNTMILARKCHTVCYQHLNHKVFLGSTKTVCGPTNKDRNIQIHLSYPDIIVETGTGAQAHSSPTTIHQNKKKWINFKYLFVHIVVPAPPLITPVTCHLNSISEGVLLKKKKEKTLFHHRGSPTAVNSFQCEWRFMQLWLFILSAFTCTTWSDYSHSSTMTLNQTTAIVQVYMPVRKSNYWPKHVIPRYARWRCIHFN